MPATATIQLGPAFIPLLEMRDPVIGVEGNRGSSKTRSILSVLMLRALQYPGSTWALWRSTRTRLSDTVLRTLETQVFPSFGLPVPGVAGADNRSHYKLPNGSSFVPVGLDDIYRGTSAEFSGGYLNEAIEISRLEECEALMGTLREDKVPFNQLIVDTNPGHPDHWFNKRFEPIPPHMRKIPANRAEYDALQRLNHAPCTTPGLWKRILAGHEDNPGYFDLANWKFTDLGHRYVEQTLTNLSGHLKRRWLYREWAVAEGVVYAEFDHDLHVIEPFPIPHWWPCYLACDPGYDHPTAIVVMAVSPSNQWYIVDELVRSRTSVAQDAQDISDTLCERFNIVRMLGDPHYMFSATKHSSGDTIANQFMRMGLSFNRAPAAANQAELSAQVELVRRALTNMTPLGAKLQVFNNCRSVINSFAGWSYKRNQKGEITGKEDGYAEAYKDEADAVRMLVASSPTFTGSSGIRIIDSEKPLGDDDEWDDLPG